MLRAMAQIEISLDHAMRLSQLAEWYHEHARGPMPSRPTDQQIIETLVDREYERRLPARAAEARNRAANDSALHDTSLTDRVDAMMG